MEKQIQPSRTTRPSTARAPAPARLRSLIGGPRLSAPTRAPLLFLSPSCCFVGPTYRCRFSRTRTRSLSLCPADPTRQPVPNLPPTSLAMDAPMSARSPATSSCPRPFRPCAPLAHFPPTHLRPQSSSLAPSLALRARPDKLRRRSPKTAAVPRPSLSRVMPVPLVSSAASPASRDTLRFVLSPSCLPGSRSPEHFLRSRSPPPSTQDFTASPPSSRRS
jgi:hypothetical protein